MPLADQGSSQRFLWIGGLYGGGDECGENSRDSLIGIANAKGGGVHKK
jgi:hypothetical protein